MIKLTKENLESMKVVDLKEYANEISLDVSGLRKSEIIESILENYKDVEEIKSEDDNNSENNGLELTEKSNQTDEKIEDIDYNYKETNESIQTINAVLDKPTMLFKDKDLKIPMFNISGLVELNIKSGAVSCNVPGRGIVNGFIAK